LAPALRAPFSYDNYAAIASTINFASARDIVTASLQCGFFFAGLRPLKRRSLLYECDIFSFTHQRTALSDKSLHQFGKHQQVRDPRDRTTLAKGNLRIGPHGIRPLRRHRAHGLIVDAQHEPRTVTVVPLGNADKLPSAKRVKWVRHAHKTRRRDGRACILS
jgi:hypothetical protein